MESNGSRWMRQTSLDTKYSERASDRGPNTKIQVESTKPPVLFVAPVSFIQYPILEGWYEALVLSSNKWHRKEMRISCVRVADLDLKKMNS